MILLEKPQAPSKKARFLYITSTFSTFVFGFAISIKSPFMVSLLTSVHHKNKELIKTHQGSLIYMKIGLKQFSCKKLLPENRLLKRK